MIVGLVKEEMIVDLVEQTTVGLSGGERVALTGKTTEAD